MAHGEWKPSDRSHDPMKLLDESVRGRVPSLVALKYERMACSHFAFFRGAVPAMAADLAGMPNTTLMLYVAGADEGVTMCLFKSSAVAAAHQWCGYTRSGFGAFVWDESAQDIIEYALIAVFIGLGTVVAFRNLAISIGIAFSNVQTALTSGV